MLRTFSCGPSVTKGQLFLVHLSSCLCSPFFIHFVISRLLCPHHQHLLLHLQRPPRPQHGAGVNPQAHPLAGGSLADWPTRRLHRQKNDERFSSTRKLVANTQIINTCRRFSKMCKRNWEGLQFMRRSQWNPTRPMYQRGDCYGIVDESCFKPWEGFREEFGNPPGYEIWECRECFDITQKNWYRNSLQ